MPGGVVAPPELIAAWQTDAFPHGIRADHSLTVISLVLTSLAFAVVFARLYDRAFVRHNVGIDDVLIAAALFPLAGLCTCTVLAEQSYGFDRHAWDMTPETAAPGRKLVLAMSVLSLSTCGLTKISILLFYRRIGYVKRWFRTTINANIAFIAVYTLAFSVGIPFQCAPASAYWNKANPLWTATHKYRCADEGASQVVAGALSALQDLIACVLPMALFWDLRISKRSKFALCFVFGLGIFTSACAVMRTVKMHRVFYETYDVTWAARWVFAPTLVEACLGAVCASAPALKDGCQRLLRRAAAGLSTLATGRGGGGSGGDCRSSIESLHRADREAGAGAACRRSKSPFFLEAAGLEVGVELVVVGGPRQSATYAVL